MYYLLGHRIQYALDNFSMEHVRHISAKLLEAVQSLELGEAGELGNRVLMSTKQASPSRFSCTSLFAPINTYVFRGVTNNHVSNSHPHKISGSLRETRGTSKNLLLLFMECTMLIPGLVYTAQISFRFMIN